MSTSPILSPFVTDTWVQATWEEFIKLAYDPAYEKSRAYYNQGKARIEMSPIGLSHFIRQFHYLDPCYSFLRYQKISI